MVREPVPEGASGLHYSGRIYTNEFQQLGASICNGLTAQPSQIGDVLREGISIASLPVDDATKRINPSALAGYVTQLQSTGKIPGQLATLNEQNKADRDFYAAIQAEYCFYESRYVAALTQFLSLVSDQRGADSNAVTTALNQTIALNRRLNSLLEIIGYVGNERIQRISDRSGSIEAANRELNEKLSRLEQQREFLESSDVRTRTQEEMMRFTAEKSRALNIQIVFFVALNIIALGTVLTVYRKSSA